VTPPRACLTDFGFSALAQTDSFLISTHEIDLGVGTAPYMAPELMHPTKFGLHSARVSREADIYAFGMSMYEVVTGVPPFAAEGISRMESIYVVIDGGRPAKPDNAKAIGFGNGVWDLVEKCWSQDRAQRPSTRDVLLRLSVAASLSSNAPPGPRIQIPQARDIDTCSTVSSDSTYRE
jgi:serine/threonine protein kinase